MELSKPDFSWPDDLRPQRFELAGLRPGSIVKLHARSGAAVWARIIEHRRHEKLFVGEVEDCAAEGVKRGDQVLFSKGHVYEVV